MKGYLNASEVAKLLKVDRATIVRWIRKGLIAGTQQSERGRKAWIIPIASIDALMKNIKSY